MREYAILALDSEVFLLTLGLNLEGVGKVLESASIQNRGLPTRQVVLRRLWSTDPSLTQTNLILAKMNMSGMIKQIPQEGRNHQRCSRSTNPEPENL